MTEISKKDTEQELLQKTQELNERLKELNCMYDVSTILEDNLIGLDESLQKVVDRLPPAWKFPEYACARISFDEKTYESSDFKKIRHCQSQPLKVAGKERGRIEVCYREIKEGVTGDPFLVHEFKLLTAISEKVGRYLEKHIFKEKLEAIGASSESAVNENGGKQSWQVILDLLIRTDPPGAFRLTRKMIYQLFRMKNDSIEQLLNSFCAVNDGGNGSTWCGINMPNPRKDLDALKSVQRQVFEIASSAMGSQEISELIYRWLKEDKSRPLLLATQKRGISLSELKGELSRYYNIPESERIMSKEDLLSIRTGLIRRFFTDRPEYINVAKNYMVPRDFLSLMDKVVGPSKGEGKLGGKASGIVLAKHIIERERKRDSLLNGIEFANSWYVTSDSMLSLIHYNALEEVIHIKYMDPDEIRQEQPFLEQVFKNSVFPPDIVNGLKKLVEKTEGTPLIVRSSSLLEDSFDAAFSGKYKSLFIANQGDVEERLCALLEAISEVYASILAPDPIEYRRERNLLDFNEEMAVLIQEVVGKQVGDYYFPLHAGVAFSNNEFRWSPRIRREDGIIRMVMGIGTRAVDRVSNDYPLIVSPKKPELRVNVTAEEKYQYSQRFMDVINLKEGIIETVPVSKIIKEHGGKIDNLHLLISVSKDGILTNPTLLDWENDEMVLTFDGLFSKTDFLAKVNRILSLLKEKMDTPVDIEFAFDGESLYILQCRPQTRTSVSSRVPVPTNIPSTMQLFSAKKYVTTSHIADIEYIVYVDPEHYESLETREEMLQVARIVGQLNTVLPRRKFILMGPGRWGTRGDIKLGVPIDYRDINNTSLLVEIAKAKGKYSPELSFGTHFFQDLVEAEIRYLPLYPDEPGNVFNTELFQNTPNLLTRLLEVKEKYCDVVKVYRVSDMSGGGTLSVVMDGDVNQALAYLLPPDHVQWRLRVVEEIARVLSAPRFGVEALYLTGTTSKFESQKSDDIDLIIHFRGTYNQRQELEVFLREHSSELTTRNRERTGEDVDTMLDFHIVTDEDIANREKWAKRVIGYEGGKAKKIPLLFS
ncbi:MAG TPA: pyruvate, phosphate dikinase [Euryarchaeota archaeon]|mgnify:CR=1 FL=1|nr:pyruvate, phosphate dikinase [Euryarchaeota archaeon]